MNEVKISSPDATANENPPRFFGLSITDATLYLAVLTAMAYMWAYFRELGNKDYYNLPDYFIEMNTETVVKAFGETWSYLAAIVAAFWLINISLNAQKGLKGLIVFMLGSSVVFAGLDYFFVDETLLSLIYVLITGVIAIQLFKNKLSKRLYIALLVILFMGYSFLIGNYQGESQEDYMVIDQSRIVANRISQQPFVILDSYGQYFIVAPFDEKTKEIIPNFELIEQKYVAQKPFTMKYKNLGRLKVREGK